MSAKVFVSNLAVHGFHGVKAQERTLGQRFFIDIECDLGDVDLSEDAMHETVDYGALCELAHALSSGRSFNLIETFAKELCDAILAQFQLVREVKVEIRKPSAPIRHIVDYVGAAIIRRRPEKPINTD